MIEQRLGVTGTPSVFVNGRSIADLRQAALEVLIDFELKKQKLQELQRVAAARSKRERQPPRLIVRTSREMPRTATGSKRKGGSGTGVR